MRRLTAVVALAALAAGPAAAADHAVAIMYHRFGEDSIPSTSIRLEQLEAHIAELASGAYALLPLGEIVRRMQAGEALPDRAVAVTVDDAYQSFFTEGWPRLKRAGIPVTLFVATEPVDSRVRGYMSWEQIRALKADGVAIGHHTHRHSHMPLETREQNAEEIVQANARYLAEIGEIPDLFAYPYGEWSALSRQIVVNAGFKAAFGQHSGVMHAGHDQFSLPRVPMNETFGSVQRLKQALNALPLRVRDIAPADPLLGDNPPAFGFTVVDDLKRLAQIHCFSSHRTETLKWERLGERRIEVRLDQPFPPGRGRISCTVPDADGRFRWFGYQFFIPAR